MKSELCSKNILLICPKFFNYHVEIMNALKSMGAEVDWFDERPSNNSLVKALLRINKNLINYKIKKYYSLIINQIRNNKYDYILIIKPEGIPKSFIKQLRILNPNAKIILEIWDSIANNKDALDKIKLVDKTFSFDPKDCEKYNLNFRPLFYTEQYNDISLNKCKYDYDLMFIGTVHSDRYKILKSIESKLANYGYKTYFYMYIPSKMLYLIRKYIFREFVGSNINEFKFKSLSQNEIISIIEKTRVVIDIHHPKQIGLTMRTIEMVGANKKLITTNNNVKEYDFYKETNIQVVDRNISNLNMKIFESEYEPIDYNIKKRYSLQSWLLELLN